MQISKKWSKWSYLVLLDRKFHADENSYKKHGLKAISPGVTVAEVMSRDQAVVVPI